LSPPDAANVDLLQNEDIRPLQSKHITGAHACQPYQGATIVGIHFR
jgi:hypothetical protein